MNVQKACFLSPQPIKNRVEETVQYGNCLSFLQGLVLISDSVQGGFPFYVTPNTCLTGDNVFSD